MREDSASYRIYIQTDMRRIFIGFFTIILAIAVQTHCELVDPIFPQYDHATRSNIPLGQVVRNSRGSRHFDPEQDGFFNDFGFLKSQYIRNEDKTDLTDIRSNIPGEPGVDYAAYLEIPRTRFSCIGRTQGYYADEEAGCQVFHVCDDDQISSFLCPVGSLFNQQLLTCDWWNRVACSQSHQFYEFRSKNDVKKFTSHQTREQDDSVRMSSNNKLKLRGIIEILQTNKLDDRKVRNSDTITATTPTDGGADSPIVKVATLPKTSMSSNFDKNDEDLEFKMYKVNYHTHYYPEIFFAIPS